MMNTRLELQGSLPIEGMNAGMQLARDGNSIHMDRELGLWHFDLIFVREGILSIQEANQAFEVTEGQTLLLWPQRRHWGTKTYPPNLRFYWLHFKIKESAVIKSASAASACGPSYNPLAPDVQPLSLPQYVTVSRPEFLESLFRRYLDDQETGRLQPAYANLLVWLILSEIADQRPVQLRERTSAALAGRAFSYIRGHLNVPLTASKVAQELGNNPEYLNRVFHQTYGHTLTEEIHRSRVGYARYLLLYSNKNIAQIALACGFRDTSYFARLFRRYEGMSAMEFRRLNAQVMVNYE